MSTIRFRTKMVAKLTKRGWDPDEAAGAAVAVFPMVDDPGNRRLEDWLRSRARVMAKTVLPKRSMYSREEQVDLVRAALEAYAGACREAGSSHYARQYEDALRLMSSSTA